MPGASGLPQLGYLRILQCLEELGFGHVHSHVTPEMVPPSHVLVRHI